MIICLLCFKRLVISREQLDHILNEFILINSLNYDFLINTESIKIVKDLNFCHSCVIRFLNYSDDCLQNNLNSLDIRIKSFLKKHSF